MPLPERIMYKDQDDISVAMQVGRGQKVSYTNITGSEVNTMVDGESRIDYKDSSEVIKMNGKLFKRVVIDSEIKLQEIT